MHYGFNLIGEIRLKNGIKTNVMVLFALELQGEDLDFWLSTDPPPASTTQPQVGILPAHREPLPQAGMWVLRHAPGEKGERGFLSSAQCCTAMTFYLSSLQTL